MKICAIVLVKNEERHLPRALLSLAQISAHAFVIDSGSVDRTQEIAVEAGATVKSNPWINYATQFNWALEQLPDDTDWVIRLDADEIITPDLAAQINESLSLVGHDVSGIYVSRRMEFLGRPVRWGGLFPIRVLRLFRHGKGHCENRWMDEHIIVDGLTADFRGEIIDNNLNSLTWWTEKHNAYASREVVDLLNLEYRFMPSETVADLRGGSQAGIKRWLKEKAYVRIPPGMRAVTYFCYRFIFRLGFLDGREGRQFHILQGFWYRYLVDAKLNEVKAHMRRTDVDIISAIKDVLGVDVQR